MNREKQKDLKKVLLLNLIIGIYKIISFSLYGYSTALIFGILNVGAWVMLRDLKIIRIMLLISKELKNDVVE